MIEHIVLFKFKPEATETEIGAVMTGLRSMAGRIEGVIEITCGANFSPRAQGFTHGLNVRLTDRAALEGYATHPVHLEVIERFINPIRFDVLALDYEI